MVVELTMKNIDFANLNVLPIGSMYAIYDNMDPINIPQMLAYIPAPWILWDVVDSYPPVN